MSTQQVQPAVGIHLIGTLITVLGYSAAIICEHMKVVLKYIFYILMNHVSTTSAKSTS